MKKNILVYSLAALITINPLSAATPEAKKGERIPSVGATVSGTVTLLAKTNRNFPNNLQDIYQGTNSVITLGKKGKKISVTGSYAAGASSVRVSENVSDSTPKYSFDLPVPAQVSGFSSGKFIKKDTLVNLYFASQEELDDNGLGEGGDGDGGGGGNNSLVNLFKKKFIKSKKPKSPIKKFKAKLHKIAVQKFLANATTNAVSIANLAATMSVKKVTATRSGNKGTLKGTFFRKGKPAKGRFSLKMTFDE